MIGCFLFCLQHTGSSQLQYAGRSRRSTSQKCLFRSIVCPFHPSSAPTRNPAVGTLNHSHTRPRPCQTLLRKVDSKLPTTAVKHLRNTRRYYHHQWLQRVMSVGILSITTMSCCELLIVEPHRKYQSSLHYTDASDGSFSSLRLATPHGGVAGYVLARVDRRFSI